MNKVMLPEADTITLGDPKVSPGAKDEVLLEEVEEHSIILYNDEVNTFEHVIESLIDVCDHTPEQAEQCAMITHYKGKCDVKHGTYDELEPICSALLERQLSAEIH